VQAWYAMESILGPLVINLLQMDVEGGFVKEKETNFVFFNAKKTKTKQIF
jgi:hypothetical protein